MSDFYNDTLKGLLEAISIENGNIPIEEVPNMVAQTYRVPNNINVEKITLCEEGVAKIVNV